MNSEEKRSSVGRSAIFSFLLAIFVKTEDVRRAIFIWHLLPCDLCEDGRRAKSDLHLAFDFLPSFIVTITKRNQF